MKKLMSTCTALLLALCMLLPAYSAFAATDNDKIGQRLEKVASQTEGATNYLYKDKDFGVADAVDMLAAVRNYDASDAQVEGFIAAVEKELKANGGKLYYPCRYMMTTMHRSAPTTQRSWSCMLPSSACMTPWAKTTPMWPAMT